MSSASLGEERRHGGFRHAVVKDGGDGRPAFVRRRSVIVLRIGGGRLVIQRDAITNAALDSRNGVEPGIAGDVGGLARPWRMRAEARHDVDVGDDAVGCVVGGDVGRLVGPVRSSGGPFMASAVGYVMGRFVSHTPGHGLSHALGTAAGFGIERMAFGREQGFERGHQRLAPACAVCQFDDEDLACRERSHAETARRTGREQPFETKFGKSGRAEEAAHEPVSRGDGWTGKRLCYPPCCRKTA